MTTRHFALLAVLLVFCTHCADGRTSSATDKVEDTQNHLAVNQNTAQINHTPQGERSAQKVYIDPETGQLVSPPEHDVPVANETMESSVLTSSSKKMEEKESPVPGGGMMIDLKGRFQSPLTVTIGETGQTEIEHD